jgi:alkanesulfonate monooxygenase SsuD/methylene tetrahydromethanopterin reductase-like flavin-dependent oxidoreductase (luciferase family)
MSELAALAGSRVFLGIGTADSAAASIGRSPATIAETESYVEAVRCELGRFRSFRGLRSEGIPVYVAAVGRKALRLAGRVGDGVIIGAGTTPEVIDASLTELARGAEEAGRDVTDIDVWWYMLGSLAHTEIEAEKDLRNSLTSFANAAFHLTLDGKEVPDQFKRSIERITSEYNPMHHAKHGGRHHSGLVDDKALREYLLQRFAVCGSPLSATTRLREIEARGVQNLWLAVRTPDKRKFVRLWGKVGSTKSLVET